MCMIACVCVLTNHHISKREAEEYYVWAKESIQIVETIIKKRRLRLLGYLAGMESHCIPRQLLQGRKRSVDGQKLRWVDFVMRSRFQVI